MRSLIALLLSGPWPAASLVFAFITAGLVPTPLMGLLAYLGASFVALVTLQIGIPQALRVMIMALVGHAIVVKLVGLPLTMQWPVVWMLASVWLGAVMMRIGGPMAWGMQTVVLSGLLLIGIIYLVLGDPVAYWQKQLWNNRTDLAQLMSRLGQASDEQHLRAMITFIAPLMTGFQVMLMVLGAMFALLLGRLWQSLVSQPGGFGEEFSNLGFSRRFGLLTLVILAVAWFVKLPLLLNLATVLIVAWVFPGLAVIHGLARMGSTGMGWLIATYLLLFFVPHMMVFMLALLGLSDSWAGFRQRRRPQDGDDG